MSSYPERSKLPKYVAPLLAVTLGVTACSSNTTADKIEAPKPSATKIMSHNWDVSFPQCQSGRFKRQHAALPLPGQANVIGINGKLPNTINPCFNSELTWAGKLVTSMPTKGTSVYVTMADPGNKVDGQVISDWPSSGSGCSGANTLACSKLFGVRKAQADEAVLPADFKPIVWFDIENSYSWLSPANNRETLQGYAEVFEARGDPVGIYSNPSTFDELMGELPADSNLRHLFVWRQGATTTEEAKANCQAESFSGQVVLAQIAATQPRTIDQNIAC